MTEAKPMALTARLTPQQSSLLPFVASRCKLRPIPAAQGTGWAGELWVCWDGREALVSLTVKRQGKWWACETHLNGKDKLTFLGLAEATGDVPSFEIPAWRMLGEEFGFMLAIEPAE